MEFVLAETRERNTSEQQRAATFTLGMRRNCHNGQSREQRNEFKAMLEFFYNIYFDYKRRNWRFKTEAHNLLSQGPQRVFF